MNKGLFPKSGRPQGVPDGRDSPLDIRLLPSTVLHAPRTFRPHTGTRSRSLVYLAAFVVVL